MGKPVGNGDTLIHRCFSYMDSYNRDIRFDNIYISTYFCQIDERRKKLVSVRSLAQECPVPFSGWRPAPGGQRGRGEGAQCFSPWGRFSQGKQTLLPLRKAEKKTVIFPWDPTIQAAEMRNVVRMAWRQDPRSY